MTTGSLATSRPLGTLGALAILGVAGFFAVVAVIHEPIGAGGGLGVNDASLLTITSGAPRSLTSADVDAISRDVPGITALSRMVLGKAQVAAGSQDVPLTVQGVDPSYPEVTSASIAPGVFFSIPEASAATPVAILGRTLADALFAGASPVGQTIRIRSVPYTVIGVLAAQAHPPAAEGADDAVLIPFQTGQVRLFGPSSLDQVMLQVRDASQTDAIRLQIQQLLRQRHQVRAGQPDGFSVGTTSPAASGDVTETTLQKMGHLLQQYRQYVCEAKGLCARPE